MKQVLFVTLALKLLDGKREGGRFSLQDTLASEENKTQIIKQRPRHFFLLFLGQATLRRCAADLFRAPTAVKCSTDSSLPTFYNGRLLQGH